MSCRSTQLRLEVDHQRPTDSDLRHIETCPECAAHRSLLVELDNDRGMESVARPLDALLARTEEKAWAARVSPQWEPLSDQATWAPLLLALLALPLALAQGWLWLTGLHWAFEEWVPVPLLAGVSVFYVGSVGVMLGLLYASIPFAWVYSRRTRTEER